MAPRVGIEPTTFRLTVERSAAELPRNVRLKASGLFWDLFYKDNPKHSALSGNARIRTEVVA